MALAPGVFMDALILDNDHAYQVAIAEALVARGLNVVCVETMTAADSFLRRARPRTLIMGERVDGRLTHALALTGECRNTDLAVVMLSDRVDDDLGEMFDLMPALRAIIGRQVDTETLAQVVLSALNPRKVLLVATRAVRPKQVAAPAALGQVPFAGPAVAGPPQPGPDPVIVNVSTPVAATLPVAPMPAVLAANVALARERWLAAARPVVAKGPTSALPVPALLPLATAAGERLAAGSPMQSAMDMRHPSKLWSGLAVQPSGRNRSETTEDDDMASPAGRAMLAGQRRLTLR